MKEYFLGTSFFILILLLVLVNSTDNIISINAENSNNAAFVNGDNNSSLSVSNLVYDIDSNPFNVSYADWTEKWWQWTYSIPWDKNPSYDDTGKYCSENQNGQVWFLTLVLTKSCSVH